MANHIWIGVMKDIHENLIKARFDKPSNVQEVVICKDSGKRANGNCRNTYMEYYRKGTVIDVRCEEH